MYVKASLWMFDLSFFATLEQRVVLLAVLGINTLRSEASTHFSDSESCLGCSNIVAQTKQARLVPMNISKKSLHLSGMHV